MAQYNSSGTPLNLNCSTPVTGYRTVMSLNGIWDAKGVMTASKDTIPSDWGHTIPVPGFANMACPGLGAYDYLFYRKTFEINGTLPDSVLLKIYMGCFGKKIWVNGVLIGEHQPNFTPGYFDIGRYLTGNGATNTLIVRVGKKGSQPPGYPTGSDYERTEYLPGIDDNVELLMSGNSRVVRVQNAPDLTSSRVRMVAHIRNNTTSSATIPVTLEVRNVHDNSLVGSTNTSISLGAMSEGDVDDYVPVPSAHLWTPEDPFLYELVVKTDNDQFDTKFGMRTFYFDPTTKKPMLNGQIYMLRGTNIAFYRFFEDSERGSKPWNKNWARQVISSFKGLNMNSVRFTIGFPPELWYEVCDEEGFLVEDEYAIWSFDNDPTCTANSITPEFKDWIYQRQNHPCVFLWDAQNETDADHRADITSALINNCRSVDIQNRPWDNGWGPAQSPTDTYELHLYFEPNGDWSSDKFESMSLIDQNAIPDNPVIINEYAWLWLNRDGSPTPITENTYNNYVPGGDAAARRNYHAEQVAQETEWFRANRYAGVMQFCGLSYSEPDIGKTSDNFLPGLSTPTYATQFQKLMKDAFAPVGLMVGYWRKTESAGNSVTFSVYVINDKPNDWTGNVTLKLMQGTALLASQVKTFTDVATGYRSSQNYTVAFPATTGNYQLIAEYTSDGVTVQSARNVTITPSSNASDNP